MSCDNVREKCVIPVTKEVFEKNFSTFVYCIARELQEASNEKLNFFTLKGLNERIKKIDSKLDVEKELENLMQHWMDSNIIFEVIDGYRFFH